MTYRLFIIFGLVLIPIGISARSLINTSDLNPPTTNVAETTNVNGAEKTDLNSNRDSVDRTLTINTNTATKSEDNNPTNINTGNANAPVNSTRAENISKLRERAKLLPLALIPLAAILYLIYERFSRRK